MRGTAKETHLIQHHFGDVVNDFSLKAREPTKW